MIEIGNKQVLLLTLVKWSEVQRSKLASTPQPPKKVSLHDNKAGLLTRASSFRLPSHADAQWLVGGRLHSQLRGQFRTLPDSLLNQYVVPFCR